MITPARKSVLVCLIGLLLLPRLATGSSAKPKTSKPAADHASASLSSLSLHDRIAQMIVVRGYGDYPENSDPEYEKFRRWIERDHVGGFIVAGRIRDGSVIPAQPFEMAVFINHVQRSARTPLFVAADFERGASMRVAETARFPYLMAFGAAHDIPAIRELGAATAREARALGVNWVFAPDADVNNNPDNPIINIRSFGEDPHLVASGVSEFIAGAHSSSSGYVLVTAKHFPGHGDTAQDSHIQLANLNASRERLESLELIPFRAAIKAGVDAVMTAHLTVPAFEPESIPATVSRNVLTGLLQDELGFKGLIVTDAMEMQGITSMYSQGDAAVRAIEAGADMLLMPLDPGKCIRAVETAVERGRISRQRINASVVKILRAKARVGLFNARTVDIDALTDQLEEEKLKSLAQSVADRAFTLVKDDGHLFPVPAVTGTCAVALTEGEFSSRGQVMITNLRRTVRDLRDYLVNDSMPDSLLNAIAGDVIQSCQRVYVAAFITVAANRGSVALQGGLNTFLQNIVSGGPKVALVSLGNPYLLRDFPGVSSYAATFSSAATSEASAARAILGEIPIRGTLPVSIPGMAKPGDGLNVPARATTASNGLK